MTTSKFNALIALKNLLKSYRDLNVLCPHCKEVNKNMEIKAQDAIEEGAECGVVS